MTRKTFAYGAWVLAGLALLTTMRPIDAAPPTVVPSPGYDARLREERAARVAPPTMDSPAPLPRSRPLHRHHGHAIHRGSH